MSEAMAIEVIAGEYAKFLGYLIEMRVPFKKDIGNSDIDVIGYNPKTKQNLVIECKAWGKPEDYPSFSDFKFIKEHFIKIKQDWSYFTKSPTNHWKFKGLDEAWLVIPGACDKKKTFENNLQSRLRITCRIIPIHELIIKILEEVKNDKNVRRKRYSDTALEFCRWLLRGFENGYIDLNELYYRLHDSKETYAQVKRQYLNTCLKLVSRNVDKRKAHINTRMNTLQVLSRLRKASIGDMVNYAKQNEIALNYNQVHVGLSTWNDLGIISSDSNGMYYVQPAYRDIITKEIRRWC